MMSLILILMFSFFNSNPPDTYQTPMHIKVADSIQEAVGDRLAARHKMKLIGQSGALFDAINELGFRFQVTGPKTKDELRGILVDCTEELVNAVNQTEGISQYLGSYPFTVDKVDLIIFLYDEHMRDIYYPSYATAFVNSGRLRYCTLEEGGMGYKTREYESYEEALKALGR